MPLPLPTKTRPKRSEAFRNALELQRLLMDDARQSDVKPLIRAGIARAFCELEETKRKLRMRPLPKAVDVTQLKKQRKAVDSGIDAS